LLELLVSLTILTVMLGLIGAALRTLSANWTANANGLERLEMLSRAHDIFERDVQGIRRLTLSMNNARRFIFTGTGDRLSFVTTEPPYPSSPGAYFIDYAVSGNGQGLDLVRSRSPYKAKSAVFPGATPANQVTLVTGPYKYQFSYLQKGGREGAWRPVWRNPNRLPDLIRLEIVSADTGQFVSQPFVVALSTDAELGCLLEGSDECSARNNGQFSNNADNAQAPTAPGGR